MSVLFGPAGNSDSFYDQGYKSSIEMPKWLKDMGLDAYEYSFGRGVNITQATAEKIGNQCKEHNISLSIHAPYYINLASPDNDKIKKTKGYILSSLTAAKWMNAGKIVFHPGSCGDQPREQAFARAKSVLREIILERKNLGLDNIYLCPETMGKKNQLGTLDEVLDLCLEDDMLIPTVDFGHIHALGTGALNSMDDFEDIIIRIRNKLGKDSLKNLHCHFSRIEYTQAGEKKHWTYNHTQYGPNFEPLAELLHKYQVGGTIICESRGTMAEDALALKTLYIKAGE
ncbi:MAG: TIM barrel protein [Mahellales bacterium]|jgi:deoxyribonuclease-4